VIRSSALKKLGLCEDSITQTFTPENAPYAFVLAKKIGALRYIANNTLLVMET
jgi:hypothetical protein